MMLVQAKHTLVRKARDLQQKYLRTPRDALFGNALALTGTDTRQKTDILY